MTEGNAVSLVLPAGVVSMAGRGEDWAAWVEDLPGRVRDLVADWCLHLDGSPTHGYCSLVMPVRTESGAPAVLKVAFPDQESEHEALALQLWGGRGAVRLLKADPRRRALLLERLDPIDLTDQWDLTACEIVARSYRDLHVPAGPQFHALTASAERWSCELTDLPKNAPLPRRLVEQAAALASGFATDPATDGTLVHTDLHYGNVLARGEMWVVIDPKPLSGDPHYELAPMLWNRFEELQGRVRDGVRQRFHTLIDVAGLDEDRARDWVIVRMLVNALWRMQDPPGRARLTSTDDWLTMCVAVAKAVQE